MKITKSLTFSQAVQNVKDNFKSVIAIIAFGIVGFFIILYLVENKHLSVFVASGVAQGLFLGVVIPLWRIVSGKKKLK